MSKSSILISILIVLVSCEKNSQNKNKEINIAGNTFEILFEKENQKEIIDFQDSVYNIIGRIDNDRWKLIYYEDIPFLDFGNTVAGIKKVSDSIYSLHLIENPTDSIIMKLMSKVWNKEMLFGVWVEEKYVRTDSADFPPPPIESISVNWPPSYEISEGKIIYDYYRKSESEIVISNTAEYITMELKSPIYNQSVDKLWRVKKLTDSLMIITKWRKGQIQFTSEDKNLESIRLFRKR